MGKRSRRRRAGHDTSAERALWAAVNAVGTPAFDRAIEAAARHGADALTVASQLLADAVAAAGDRGWSDADLDHVLIRAHSAEHARAAAGRPLPAGTSVTSAIRVFVEALQLVARLPEEYAGARRTLFSPGAGALDDRILKRVRALLAKAESTEFPEEAEALSAKAQELIARHAIDALLVDDSSSGGPAWRRVYLDDPYVDAKSMILGGVARANRCTVVYTPAFAWCTVFGYPGDLDAVQLLHASLLAQASRAMARAGSVVDATGRSRTRAFRRAFLVGFAERIADRLQQATASQIHALDTGALLPVLAARDERVEALRREAFPNTVQRPTRISSAEGLVAGHAAADVADLSAGAGKLSPPAH